MSAPAIGPGTLCRFLGPSGPDLPAVGSVWVCDEEND